MGVGGGEAIQENLGLVKGWEEREGRHCDRTLGDCRHEHTQQKKRSRQSS